MAIILEALLAPIACCGEEIVDLDALAAADIASKLVITNDLMVISRIRGNLAVRIHRCRCGKNDPGVREKLADVNASLPL